MGIIRVIKNKENPYVMVNKKAVTNRKLTWAARGLLTYLLSKPDNWQIYLAELSKHSPEGIKKTAKYIRELISAGYIERIHKKADGGKFCGWDYKVYEQPLKNSEKNQNAKNQKSANGLSVFGTLLSNDYTLNTDLTNKEDKENFLKKRSNKTEVLGKVIEGIIAPLITIGHRLN